MGLGLGISSLISNPLKLLAENAKKVAQGDYTIEIISDTKDEVGELMQSLALMISANSNTFPK